jgi:hypothetical protein
MADQEVLKNVVKYVINNGGKIYPLIINYTKTNGTGLMNPSIFLDNGKKKVILRHVNYTLYHSELKVCHHTYGPLQYLNPENEPYLITTNFYCTLDDNYEMTSSKKIDTSLHDKPSLWEFIGLEDARLVRWNGKLWTCGVRRDTTTNGEGRMEMCEIIEENNSIKEISRLRLPPPNDKESYCEKNWMPILDMPYHFIKWTNPTEIVKVNIDNITTETVILKEQDINIDGDLRGGSQVIKWRNYHVAITHEVRLFNNILGEKDAIYRHRIVLWDEDWNIVNYSPDFSFMSGDIEFCCGLAFENGNFLITFGFQDNCAFLLEMPEILLNDLLVNPLQPLSKLSKVQPLRKDNKINDEEIELISTGILNDKNIYNLINSIDYPTKELVIFNNNNVDLDKSKLSSKFINKITVCTLPNNIGCAGYWNLTIKCYLDKPYWILTNDDIMFTQGFLEKMLVLSKDKEIGIVHGSRGHYEIGSWSLFLIKRFVIEKYGIFDENFYPGYCEDMDYYSRILADGNTLKRILGVGVPYYHDGSLINNEIHDNKEPIDNGIKKILFKNQEYMDLKWGKGWRWDKPYNRPYDNNEIPLSYTSYDLSFLDRKIVGDKNV